VSAAGTAAPARAGSLESELLNKAPKVLKYLRVKGYHNVGVLKFRVKKDKGPLTDNAGPLNLTLAHRLEMALILANDVRKPVGIIQDASAVAAKLPGANHLTSTGRTKFFQTTYPLAWGDAKVSPDAFLTGVAQVRADLRGMAVGILAFDMQARVLEKVAEFTAVMNAAALVESGESFLLRGAFDSGKHQLVENKAIQTAARVKNEEQQHPLKNRQAPIKLKILYDGKPVRLKIRDGKALIKEPRRGQEVVFVLERKDNRKDRLGVVLKVNGENTKYRERLQDIQCTKYIFLRGRKTLTVRGYQIDKEMARRFRILSRAESKEKEMNYGADVGTISVVVFRERGAGTRRQGPADPSQDLSDEAEDLAALRRGVYPRDKPKNLDALRQQLREDARRGLIDQGRVIKSKVRRVRFKADPTPVMAATITYYRP
jgi:hypothetical protein